MCIAMLLRGKGIVGDVPAPLLLEPPAHLLVEAGRPLAAKETDSGEGGGPGPPPRGVAEPLLEERGGQGGRVVNTAL